MKIIIAVYDRELSKQLAVLLSNKKFFTIEAESFEEVPALLQRHASAMIISEETSVLFYQKIKEISPDSEIFFLSYPSFSTSQLFTLQSYNIRSVISYTENAYELVEKILQSLSMNSESRQNFIEQKNDPRIYGASENTSENVAIYLNNDKKWIYGTLEGFNTSKVAVLLDDPAKQEALLENNACFLIYLQSMNIRFYADFIFHKENISIFRYRKMSTGDAERLSYYIHYCQKVEQNPKKIVNDIV
ncbi:MAG: hypothetical protein ACRCS8_01750 [Brevinema sp.]